MPDDRRPAPETPPAETRLSDADRRQLHETGISESRLRRQVELLRLPPPHTPLERPCALGDGILVLDPADEAELLDLWRDAAAAGRLTKMVPASGAATRMFGLLRRRAEDPAPGSRRHLEQLAAKGDAAAAAVLRLLAELPRLPFFEALREALSAAGWTPDEVIHEGAYVPLLDCLLSPGGLGYGSAPKALIAFHGYAEGPRTAFAEQLAQGAHYLADANGRCRLHFTISASDRAAFEDALIAVRQPAAGLPALDYEVDFSTQDPATDTVALDSSDQLARDRDGAILLRPAGHGALLGNLERLGGDLVMLQNIDNVVPAGRQAEIIRWKRLLTGQLVRLERELAALHRRLDTANGDAATARDVAATLARLFAITPPAGDTAEGILSWLRDRLARPVRVCGVVPNVGEPGGGPFWVRDAGGSFSGQIVEPPEVDRDQPEQLAIWNRSTHFNPANMVLSLRAGGGQPYALGPLVDDNRYLRASRRHEGDELRVLERPGLWNGSMAGWNTCFVEMPISTFNPVKTVFDLLRPEHQPDPEP
jgi:hypothetical protein